jgi:hypothetical protein
MNTTLKNKLPVDIELPDHVLLGGGTMFVTLRTLSDLEAFWSKYRFRFKYACEGRHEIGNDFLHPYQWVFGTSKSSVIKTVFRWGVSGIGCEFFDWRKHDPREYECFFREREIFRHEHIGDGTWSDDDETEFQADCINRDRENYYGWWRFCNMPNDYDPAILDEDEDLELVNPKTPIDRVVCKLSERIFNAWMDDSLGSGVDAHDRISINETINYWRNERDTGQGYYGIENEINE